MGVLRFGMSTRRAALDGLARIMDATALEELFSGSDEDARFMLDLLGEAVRGRQAGCYWEVCRTARRRGVTPEFVADRASVLLASIEERRRSDVYRLLGVPPLADPESIRHRWLDVAKREHPDVGGDPQRFRRAKEAYELLKDPTRRAEYEKYWLRALGPFERVAPPVEEPGAEGVVAAPRRVVMVGRRSGEGMVEADRSTPRVVPTPVDATTGGPAPSFTDRLADVRAAVARLDRAALEQARREIADRIASVESIKADLAAIARAHRTVLGR